MLTVSDLSKNFGDLRALDGVSFEVAPGRITGFLGPNGAGKTTAMRCIFDLVQPDAGAITWMGDPVDQGQRLRFGYMPEERGLYPKMKLGEQLSYFGRLSGLSKSDASEATERWLDSLGLSDRAESRLEELSHGNQQRVQLAAALVHTPELAVLDEPFSGLDPLGVETMASVLRDLAAGGAAILFSSHQLDLVEDVCEDVVIIDRGRVVVSGEVEKLRFASPVRHLEIEVSGRAWSGADGELQVVERNGRRHYVVDSTAAFDRALAEARRDGDITKLVFDAPGLSDLFREAVEQ